MLEAQNEKKEKAPFFFFLLCVCCCFVPLSFAWPVINSYVCPTSSDSFVWLNFWCVLFELHIS